METKRVATQNAGKIKAVFQFLKTASSVLIFSIIFSMISCDTSDDLDFIKERSPLHNGTPPYSQPPGDTGTTPDNSAATDEQSHIVYTDLEPDFSSNNLNDSYKLDLNNDQIIDFILISQNSDGWEWLGVSSANNTINGIISIAPWYTHPLPLYAGQEIFKLRGYSNGEFYDKWSIFSIGECFGGDKDCFYSWKNKVDMYLGLKFIINGQTHYGWASLEVISPTKWKIKDYAYNATPDKPILAGQKK